MSITQKRVAVIGSGASGMLCAGMAAKGGCSVTLFEKKSAVGRKIAITGKGRCNVTNDCDRNTFIENVPTNPRFLYAAFSAFSSQDTMAFFNEQVLLIPQCETTEALESIEEIAAINGVDGIFVGPYDLSIAMGIPGEFSNPKFLAALDRIIQACRKAGKFTMIFTGNQQAAIDYLINGFDSVSYSMDAAFLVNGCRNEMNALRNGIKKAEEQKK